MSLLFPGAGLTVKEESKDITFSTIEETDCAVSSYICPECMTNKSVEVFDRKIICMDCSILIQHEIDMGPEYRHFEDQSSDPTRVGNTRHPLFYHSSGASLVQTRPGDSYIMKRIAKLHSYGAMPSRERTRWNVFQIINLRCANSGISLAIIEETKYIHAQIAPFAPVRRKAQLNGNLAACTFESLKRHGSVQHPNDVAKIYDVEPLQMTKSMKELNELLEMYDHEYKRKDPTYVSLKSESALTTSTTFKDYIEASLIKLNIPRMLMKILQTESEKMGDIVNELGECRETTPRSLAATAISLACEKMEHPKSTEDVAKALGISAATLHKCLTKHTRLKSILFKE